MNILNRNKGNGSTLRFASLMGMLDKENQYKTAESIPSKDRTMYSQERYQFFLDAPFEISSKCCNIMKKTPAHKYTKETGRKGITAQMASESRLRTQKWLDSGCNGFNLKTPISNPMGFWVEQDVLLYIRLYGDEMIEHRIKEIESIYSCPLEEIIDTKTGEQMFKREELKPICSVYGDIVTDDEESGQMNMAEMLGCGIFDLERPLLHTTGASRTGCMFCGYGCHLEKRRGRFERLKQTHPKQYEFIMKPVENGGLGYKEVIDWINEHGKLNIKY